MGLHHFIHTGQSWPGTRLSGPGDVLKAMFDPTGMSMAVLPSKAKPKPMAIDQGNNRFMANSFKQIGDYLASADVPSSIIPWATAQVMFETNGLKSNISKTDLNLSGIKYINKPYQKATQGNKAPDGGYFAKYASYSDWANDFKRILSIGGAQAPIRASSIQDYVTRLKNNHYFTSNPAAYLQGMQLILSAAGNLQGQQATQLHDQIRADAAIKADADKESWFKKHPVLAGVGITVGVIVVLKMIMN